MLTPATKKEKFKKIHTPTKEQSQAIDHEGSDLLLSAGAGSGKTATLTDRIIKRITDEKHKIDISKILVVTYTKDAANELKTRIAEKLGAQLQKKPNDPWLSSQYVNVTSADICTIHSFCFKCIRPYFDKLGLDGDVHIGEQGQLDLLKAEAMTEVLDEFYEAETVDPDFLLAVDCCSSYTDDSSVASSLIALNDRDLSSCAEGIDILLRKHTPGTEFFQTPHGKALLKHVKRIVDHFYPLIKAYYTEALSDEYNNKKYVACLCELNRMFTELNDCLKQPTYMGVKAILEGYSPAKATGGKKDAVPTFVDLELMNTVRNDANKKLNALRDEYFYSDTATIDAVFEQNEKICFAIHKVLTAYQLRYQEKKKKYSLCDFDDLEKMTLKLFYEDGKVSEIAEEIKRSYVDIYIDEYQDVNSVQDKIFTAISNNNRFMVGDIKQSIYGFRSAEPELFSDYRDRFLPYEKRENGKGATIFMSDNFRCDPDVIDLTNYMSDYMFGNSFGFCYDPVGDKLKHAKDHEEYYEEGPLKGTLKPFNPQKVELCIIDKDKIDKDDNVKESFLGSVNAQAEFVAQEIHRLLNSGKLPNGDDIKEKHIAILLKKHKRHAQKYIDALNKYGINHEYHQKVNFFEKPHIILLTSILNVIDNPTNDVYLAAAMHSCIWKFSLEELVQIKKSTPNEQNLYATLKKYKGEHSERVKKFLEELDEMCADTEKLNSYEIVSYVMNKKSFCSFCNKEERQDAIKLYNMARTFEQGSFKGLYSFLRHLEDLSANGGIEEAVSSDPKNSVKIITMHKSKGLEYEICFLCDLDKDYFKGIPVPDIRFHRSIGICGYISRDGGVVKYNNLLRKCIDLAKTDEDKEEAMRLLYVAMTRARSKLYLIASVPGLENKQKLIKLYDRMADPYLLYSKTSHIDILLYARPYLYSFLDERPNVIESIYNSDGVENNTKISREGIDINATLKERFGFKYGYSHLGDIPSKISISTLHPVSKSNEDESDDEATQHASYKKKEFSVDYLPTFDLKKDKSSTGAERGTATHVFLQFCDFKNLKENGYEAELNRLINEKFISASVAKLIIHEHIEKLRSKTEIIDEFINAKRIIREFRFTLMLPANEFFANEKITTETVLVQGVVDLLYENSRGEFILVDYKTDKEINKDKLKEKHRVQLTNYKRACESMFQRKISKVQIYSVPLAEAIEV